MGECCEFINGMPSRCSGSIPYGAEPRLDLLVDLFRSDTPIPKEIRDWLADLLDPNAASDFQFKELLRRKQGKPEKPQIGMLRNSSKSYAKRVSSVRKLCTKRVNASDWENPWTKTLPRTKPRFLNMSSVRTRKIRLGCGKSGIRSQFCGTIDF